MDMSIPMRAIGDASVVFDWDTSNFSDIMKTYKKYGDINEIKSITTLSNGYKNYIKEFAVEKWGDIFPEQDYADAACIALVNKRSIENA